MNCACMRVSKYAYVFDTHFARLIDIFKYQKGRLPSIQSGICAQNISSISFSTSIYAFLRNQKKRGNKWFVEEKAQ